MGQPALGLLLQHLRDERGLSLRELYRAIEKPGKHALAIAHAELDATVRVAYGMQAKEDVLQFLLGLNHECADLNAKGASIQEPGIPSSFRKPNELITDDRIQMPGLRLVAR